MPLSLPFCWREIYIYTSKHPSIQTEWQQKSKWSFQHSWRPTTTVEKAIPVFHIRWRRDYIIGFVTPAIGPNKSKKLTQPVAPAHNIRGKVWMKNNIHGFTDNNLLSMQYESMHVVFHSNFAAYIVCRCYKLWEFLGFVWTDCWGKKIQWCNHFSGELRQVTWKT